MLTHRFPFPPNRGDRIRSYHLLRELASEFSVTIGSIADEPVTKAQQNHIAEFCEDVFVFKPSRLSRWCGAASSILNGKSITEGMFSSRSLFNQISQRQKRQPFEAVLVFCSSMYPFVDHAAFQNSRILVDLVDVDSRKWEQLGDEARFPKNRIYRRESKLLRQLEQQIANSADGVTLVSEEEAELYRRTVRVPRQQTIAGISNGVDTDFFQPGISNVTPKRPEDNSDSRGGLPLRLVFTGVMNYHPNVEGIEWFCREILPQVQSKTAAQIQIVGRRPAARVKALAQLDGVDVVGEVPDVRPFLNQADVAISPLKLARGIQNKVLEAMAMQLPVVCTPQSAEGICGDDGVHFLLADSVDEWCNALVDLSNDNERRHLLATAARRLVVNSYSWSAQLQPMLELLKPSTRELVHV